MSVRSSIGGLRRKVLIGLLSLASAGGIMVMTPAVSQAHGSPTSPGSRTYLCYQDMILSGNLNMPRNSQCGAAVTSGTTQPLWDWFGVLRSDGAGRTSGFIPDGQLCAGGNAKWADYNTPGTAWPVTHLTSGGKWTVHYNAWAAHPGGFRLFITKDGYDPSKPLAWSDLESVPFSTWSETVPNGQGEYYWDVTLPQKTGRHIIYSVWARTDSTETFYGCSDVNFDGGNGNVTGIPGYDGDTGTTQPPAVTPTTAVPTTPVTSNPATVTPTTPVVTPTTVRPTTPSVTPTTAVPTTAVPTTSAPPAGGTSCTATLTAPNPWSTGYQGSLTVLNKGAAINPWTVTFSLPSGVTINNGWNGDFSSSGGVVTVKAPSWATSIGSNAQINVGFIANGPSNPLPSNFKLNGQACGGPGDTSTPTPSVTPTRTTTPVTPTTVPVTPTTVPVTPTTTTTVPVTPITPTITTTGAPTCAGAAIVCDGFDGLADGSSPASGGQWSVVTPDCSGSSKAVIDDSVKHSGTGSLRIDGAAGYCNHVFVQAAASLDKGTPLYARVYVRHSTPQPVSHTTFIAMSDKADGNKDLRIGGQNSALQWNRSSDDATLPEQSPNGVAKSTPLPIGGWQCLEFKVDGTTGTAATWLNGTEVQGLTADGVKTQDVDGQWYGKNWKPQITNLKLGWEAYGEGSDTLWYDDVKVASTRVGC